MVAGGVYPVAQVLGATPGRSPCVDARRVRSRRTRRGRSAPSFVREVALTFFLMLTITAVATDVRAVGPSAALAIGGVVAIGSLSAVP